MNLVIALDGMGGDAAPGIVIDGARQALREQSGLRFLVYGDEAKLKPLLDAAPDLRAKVALHHTPDAVAADAKPSHAVRHGRNSSMRLAIDAVKAGEAAAAVSAGNTGALMGLATLVLRTLPGIDRPAIAAVLPTSQRPVVVLDLGANVDCSDDNLVQFAVMGEVFSRVILAVAKPRVALLNIGTEEQKGDDVIRKTAARLKDSSLAMHFAGFIEGHGVTQGDVDVVVTDGFTGNVALKIAEGTAAMYTQALREAFAGGWRGKLGYLIARPALRHVRDRFDARRYNGAMFLGLNGVVVKSHGGTDAVGFANAVRVAADLVRQRTNERIIEEMASVAALPHAHAQAAAS
jgi:glycerol-3-phosphate acyltransferase PlsX